MASEVQKRSRKVSVKTKMENIDKKISRLKSQIADLEKEKLELEKSLSQEKVMEVVEYIKESGVSIEALKEML